MVHSLRCSIIRDKPSSYLIFVVICLETRQLEMQFKRKIQAAVNIGIKKEDK